MTIPEETGPELREKAADLLMSWSYFHRTGKKEPSINSTEKIAAALRRAEALLPPNQGARPEDAWLDELERLLKRATPGWRANSVNIYSVVSNQSHPIWTLSDSFHREVSSREGPFVGEDRELLLAMYNALPCLIAIARAAGANHDR